jgi:ubiquitin-conjugating enzyme E2 Q
MGENICHFQVLQTSLAPLEAHRNSLDQTPQSWSSITRLSRKSNWTEAMIFLQEKEMDALDQIERDIALLHLMNRIPPVLDMRKYLIEKPGCPLNTMTLLDANALALLRWIIASNTSLLVQDDEVPNPEVTVPQDHVSKRKVLGLEDEWMQFRFVQGSPEKELRFVEELESMKEKNSIPEKFPTMFAWHGSPVSNWHSIIRSGLDFQSVRHGRAYGNGVYFSNTMSTSLSYTGAIQNLVGLNMVSCISYHFNFTAIIWQFNSRPQY